MYFGVTHLIDEIVLYLSVVEYFRAHGCDPVH